MGSNFFSKVGDYAVAPFKAGASIISNPKNALDPVGATLAQSPLAQSPTFSRLVAQDPLFKAFSQVSPGAAAIGNTYINRNNPGDVALPAGYSIAGPSAGQNPSLTGAAASYGGYGAMPATGTQGVAPYGTQLVQATQKAQQAAQQPANTQSQSRSNAAASIWG